MVLGMHHVSN
uniref:Uncharacterized protein n=1 Tax=Rhizophora mucronata TaxID=61149 RepID=A0A2P2PBW3_RHIMU